MGMSPQRRDRNWGDIITMFLRLAADARSCGSGGRTTDAVSLPPEATTTLSVVRAIPDSPEFGGH